MDLKTPASIGPVPIWVRELRVRKVAVLVLIRLAEGEWASVNLIASGANRPIAGVGIFDSGLFAPTSPKPRSSARMKIMLGGCSTANDPLTGAIARKAASNLGAVFMWVENFIGASLANIQFTSRVSGLL